MLNQNTTVIIDGNSVAYRVFYKAPPLAANGMQTGVLHVFMTIINSFRKNPNISKIIIVFDAKGKNIRHEMFDEYKATREAMPEDLARQLEALRELIVAYGIPMYSVSGYEADDVIYTLSQTEQADKVWLVTKDKDLYQLVSDKVSIYDYQVHEEIKREQVFEKFGLYPEKIVDMLSLMGDTSDNIPGVKGIGAKTAVNLINTYGDLDGVYSNIDKIKGKQQENLIRDKEQAYLSHKLVQLLFVDGLEVHQPERDTPKLIELLTKYNLTSLLSQLKKELETGDISEETAYEQETKKLEYGEPLEATLLSCLDNTLYVSDDRYYREYNDSDNPSYYYDIKGLLKHGYQVDITKIDIMLASWLINPDSSDTKYLKSEDVGTFLAKISRYVKGSDKKLKELMLDKLYHEIEVPVSFILSAAEVQGIKVEPQVIKTVAEKLKSEIILILAKISKRAYKSINLNSPKQLGEYLFDDLGMTAIKKNKRGYSTDEDVLLDLCERYPEHAEIIEDILKYRELNKFLSTYTLNILDYADDDNYIHTDFKQTGTATGRLSSAHPNLQNIPQRSLFAEELRSAFISSEGYTFVAFDYSQIELRILAHISGDENLIYAFNHDADIHEMTAKQIFNINDVTPDYRRIAKAVNFGVLYGLSAFGLSRDVKIKQSDSKKFIEGYFTLYPKVKEYLEQTVAQAKDSGYSETILGRKRFIPDLNSRNGSIRNRAERMTYNAPIQGSAADIIKLAMIKCNEYINRDNIDARLILQIHDELIFEVADDRVEKFMQDIKMIMESVIELKVPLTVNGEFAKNWGGL